MSWSTEMHSPGFKGFLPPIALDGALVLQGLLVCLPYKQLGHLGS